MMERSCPEWSSPVIVRDEGEFGLVFQPAVGGAFKTDEVATVICRLIGGGRTVMQIAAEVAEQYAVSPDSCLADVKEFVIELTNLGLVRLMARENDANRD